MRKILYIVLCFTLISGCRKEQLDDCFSSTGDDITIERPVKPFNKINIGEKFKVTLIQDTIGEPRFQITAGKNVVEGIVAKVENGVLSVENCNVCNFMRTYKREIKLKIFIRDLEELFVYGATSVTNQDTLHFSTLHIDHSALEDMSLTLDVSKELYIQSINSGGLTLKGKCNIFKSSIEEITDVDARDFVCEEVLMDTHTPLNCYVQARRLLFVKIYNKGNIFYVGEPSGLKEVNVQKGEGRLLPLN